MSEPIPRRASPNLEVNRPARHVARYVLCLALLLALPGGAQNSAPSGRVQTPRLPGQQPGFGQDDDSNGDTLEQEKRLRALNVERQKAMVSDTKKLLKLATELNSEVASTQPESLNADQLQKLAEIEKLAHSVKDKMSTSVKGPPAFRPPGPEIW